MARGDVSVILPPCVSTRHPTAPIKKKLDVNLAMNLLLSNDETKKIEQQYISEPVVFIH